MLSGIPMQLAAGGVLAAERTHRHPGPSRPALLACVVLVAGPLAPDILFRNLHAGDFEQSVVININTYVNINLIPVGRSDSRNPVYDVKVSDDRVRDRVVGRIDRDTPLVLAGAGEHTVTVAGGGLAFAPQMRNESRGLIKVDGSFVAAGGNFVFDSSSASLAGVAEAAGRQKRRTRGEEPTVFERGNSRFPQGAIILKGDEPGCTFRDFIHSLTADRVRRGQPRSSDLPTAGAYASTNPPRHHIRQSGGL